MYVPFITQLMPLLHEMPAGPVGIRLTQQASVTVVAGARLMLLPAVPFHHLGATGRFRTTITYSCRGCGCNLRPGRHFWRSKVRAAHRGRSAGERLAGWWAFRGRPRRRRRCVPRHQHATHPGLPEAAATH